MSLSFFQAGLHWNYIFNNKIMNISKSPCQICPKMNIAGRVNSSVTKRSYTVPADGTCGHNNLVYLVTCTKCSKQYVGVTGITINHRFYYHLYDNLKHPKSAPPECNWQKLWSDDKTLCQYRPLLGGYLYPDRAYQTTSKLQNLQIR